MNKIFHVLRIVVLGLTAALISVLISIKVGAAAWLDGQRVLLVDRPALFQPQAQPEQISSLLSSACAVRPHHSPGQLRRLPSIRAQVPLDRFRRETGQLTLKGDDKPTEIDTTDTDTPGATPPPAYTPREKVALAHPSNFGRRFLQDAEGREVSNPAVVVIHETVGSVATTLKYFQTSHPQDADQVSYHTLIKTDGTILYLVPPDRRAFGAGNSVFTGPNGVEAVTTNPKFPPSVNNFAYHIALVTPADGRGNGAEHSGYTPKQYQSLAWLVAKTGVPDERITAHRLIDRSRQRKDPRSFNARYFQRLLAAYPRTNDIVMQCSLPALPQEE